jgi:predicted RNA-binding Zn ribbon-like protein
LSERPDPMFTPVNPVSQRLSAPGDLGIVQAFLNSVDYEADIEYLVTPESFLGWMNYYGFGQAGLIVTEEDLRRAITFRETLRDVVAAKGGDLLPVETAARLAEVLDPHASLRPVAREDGSIGLEPAIFGIDAAFVRLLAICHDADIDGSWQRFKLCRNPECRWAFYDTSKNRSSVWCDMAICGSRHKARAYRDRKRQTS